MKLRALLAVPLLLVGAALEAREQACRSEGGSLRRTRAVNVLDERMQPVSGLTAADFRGRFRDEEVRIVSVTADTQPRRIVLLVDVSESMATRVGRWGLAVEAAEHLLGTGPPDSTIALVTFAEKVEARTGFEFETQKARQALKAVRPAGDSSDPSGTRTALRDAVMEATRLLTPSRTGDAIYLITDGYDTFSRAKDEEVEAALLGSGARLFAVVLPDWAGPSLFVETPQGPAGVPSFILLPLTTALTVPAPPPGGAGGAGGRRGGRGGGGGGGAVALRALVDASGGLGMTAGAVGTSAPRFDYNEKQRGWFFSQAHLLYGAMGEFYRLDVELPEEPDRLREWRLEVVGADGKKLKDVYTVYPRKLAPCASDH